MGELPRHIKIIPPETDISTFSLFGLTDYCITVRGTIGIEMPCFGIRVFTAGTGRYSGLGFTTDSATREEYLRRMRCIQDYSAPSPEEMLLAKKHAYTLLRLRPCAFSSFQMTQMPVQRLGHPLDHNVTIRVRSPEELRAAPDLNRFADWVTHSRASDYLAQEADAAMDGIVFRRAA